MKAQAILIGVLVVVCAIAAVFGYRSVDNMLHPQATLTNSVVARQLEKIQDLRVKGQKVCPESRIFTD